LEATVDVPYIGSVEKDEHSDQLMSEPWPIPFLRGCQCRFALEGYLGDQRQDDFHRAIKNALTGDESVLSRAQPYVLQYCREMLALYAQDPPAVRLEPPTDVWKHVRFGDTIYVRRRDDGDDEDGIYLSLECNCDWEVEHGLQIVLRDGLEITKVGPFDGHLTNSDAFGDPALKGVVYRGFS
jgi:hypothetical protein